MTMHKFYFIIIALVCSQCKTIDTNQSTKETPTVSDSNTSFVDTLTSFSQSSNQKAVGWE